MSKYHRDKNADLVKFDLNLLGVFDMVMVERHVTRAAERLELSQSAVSNSLARLRILFKDALFIKAPRGVEPTPRALALWPDIHSAIERLQRTVRPGSFQPDTAECEFRLSMADLAAALLTPYLFSNVNAQAPKVAVTLLPHDPQLTVRRFAQGEIDFAIGVEPPRLAVLENKPLWSERYVVVGRRDHPAIKKPLTLDKLCNLPQLAVSLSSGTRICSPVDLALNERGRSRQISLTVNQFLVATAVLRDSELLAILPARLVGAPYSSGWLVAKPLPIEVTPAVIYLTWHRRSDALSPMTWFKECIADSIDRMNAGVEAHARQRVKT
jgi:DNA-binding transcriptional LysR family regulator